MVSCNIGGRPGLDLVLQWLWRSSDSTPSLGMSICRGCGPKKQKIKIKNRKYFQASSQCSSSPLSISKLLSAHILWKHFIIFYKNLKSWGGGSVSSTKPQSLWEHGSIFSFIFEFQSPNLVSSHNRHWMEACWILEIQNWKPPTYKINWSELWKWVLDLWTSPSLFLFLSLSFLSHIKTLSWNTFLKTASY